VSDITTLFVLVSDLRIFLREFQKCNNIKVSVRDDKGVKSLTVRLTDALFT
jgi:hypothetical protein